MNEASEHESSQGRKTICLRDMGSYNESVVGCARGTKAREELRWR